MKDSINKVFDKAPTSIVTNYKESYGVILQNPSGEHLSNQFMFAYVSIIIVVLLGVHFMIKKVKKWSDAYEMIGYDLDKLESMTILK